jgi:hypothetical protein
MLIIAAPGLKVPKETRPRDYITDAQPVEVPDTAYYRRRLADGDLRPVEPQPAEPTTKTKGKS